jgi:hypothetical protein
MRDGCEVEPRKNRIANQVGLRIGLDVIPLPDPIKFEGCLVHEVVDSLPELVMPQADGAVRASDSAASIDLFVAPVRTRHENAFLPRGLFAMLLPRRSP